MTGISDNRPELLDAPAFRALNIDAVRLVVPWDAADRPGRWDAWLDRAHAVGADVLVAFDHADGDRCPGAPCVLPSIDSYENAIAAFLRVHPAVHTLTAWNEPNHPSQPTAHAPDAAAAYHDAARRVCPSCTVVAGDLLDGAAMASYLAAYQSALVTPPAVWGLHDYYDATYFQSSGVDALLRATTGPVWLTETGGLVSFTSAAGSLPYDEQRAADGVSWIYQLTDRRPRIARVYFYQWQGDPGNAFDSGLVGYDGTPRPGYDIVRARVGLRAGAAPILAPRTGDKGTPRSSVSQRPVMLAPPGRTARLRTLRRLRLLSHGRLELRARCISFDPAETRCRQRLVARVTGRVVTRVVVDVRAGRTFVRVVRLPGWARRALTNHVVQLQSCRVERPSCTARVAIPLSRVKR
ncbi:glycosyl hydrolase [Baekduia sp.]|uniref:glycosyl hydrolase n=1 Tax=Baekduia sp. TaxID=2600305 RepID=UPI002E06C660|nr:glycosyl hydrolase [Baekduia sp.]